MVWRTMKRILGCLSLVVMGSLPLVAGTESRVANLESQVRELTALVEQLSREVRGLRGSSGEGVVRERGVVSPTGYVVQAGDTMGEIANRHGFGIQEMLAANPRVDPSRLQIGARLSFPGGGSGVSSGGRVSSSAGTYTVRSGETFSGIAERHGVSTASLISANPGIPPTRLRVGTSLRIPGGQVSRPVVSEKESPRVASRVTDAPRYEPDPVEDTQSSGERLVEIQEPTRYITVARKYGTSVATLNHLNQIQLSSNQLIAAGSELWVP